MNGHVHYGLTRGWALSEGFSAEEAEAIASADVRTDRRRHSWPLDWRFHWALAGATLVAWRRTRRAADTRDLELLGEALHAAQDAVGHGFLGHFNHYEGIDIWDRRPAGVRERIEARTRYILRRYRVMRGLPLVGSQTDLIATLNEVAGAVSSAMSAGEVLDSIVERVKTITATDKAVIVLTEEHSPNLDRDSIVVRGRRGQHEQEWWGLHLDALGDTVFAGGEPIIEAFPDHHAVILACPVIVRDRAVGLICAINSTERPFTPEQVDGTRIVSAFAGAAIENARLVAEGRHVLIASERARIAREMHDGVVQSLFSISLGLETCKKLAADESPSVAVRIDELQEHLSRAMSELRYNIYDLQPVMLTELGLIEAIRFWLDEMTQGSEVNGRLVVVGMVPSLAPAQDACLYSVTKESISNAVRHARAGSIEVRVESIDDRVRLTVEDDGIGFDRDAVPTDATTGFGLHNMSERVSAEGGRFDVESAPGRGTVIVVELPVGGTGT